MIKKNKKYKKLKNIYNLFLLTYFKMKQKENNLLYHKYLFVLNTHKNPIKVPD